MKSYQRNMEELEKDIEKGIEQGQIRDIDPHTGAVIISGIANGLYFDWAHGESKERVCDILHKATDIIENGVFLHNERVS